MSNYSDKSGQTCSNNNDCAPYGWCGNGKCYQTCTLNSQSRRNYKCICNEGGSNQNCPQGTSCQGNVCQEIPCPGLYQQGIKGPVFFLQPGDKYSKPILDNQQPASLQTWDVDRQFFDKNSYSNNKVAQQIQEFVSGYLTDKDNLTRYCSLFLSGGGTSRLGKLGYYKENNKYYYQMSYGNGDKTKEASFTGQPQFKNTQPITLQNNNQMSYGNGDKTKEASFTGQPQFKNTQPITLQNNNQEVQELERLRQQIKSNEISIDTYNRKIEELKEGIIIKRADAERKERQVETQNRQIYGQSKDLENKINLLQTRKAMLDFAIERNNFKNKQIYTQISGICAVLIIMILLYVFFTKFYQS